MRKKLMAANWKMYKNPSQTRDFFRDFLPTGRRPYARRNRHLPALTSTFMSLSKPPRDRVSQSAGKICTGKRRALTPAKSPRHAAGFGCTHVIIGHSERRQYFGESDDIVNFKLKAALEAGLAPIVCVGEVLEEREANLTEDVLRRQCLRAFHAISGKKAVKLVVAYEPVWAIGTGKTATPQLAAEAHLLIRGEAAKAFGEEFSRSLRILYGGSVKPENVKALMAEEEIDGALVGGASLDPKSFAAIVKY